MAVDSKTQLKLRETKENTFNILKGLAPIIFGTKVWTDVSFFGEDPNDSSKIIIIFNEE